eukprot:13487362-Alexandrium_andersonii.AAC.1
MRPTTAPGRTSSRATGSHSRSDNAARGSNARPEPRARATTPPEGRRPDDARQEPSKARDQVALSERSTSCSGYGPQGPYGLPAVPRGPQ